MAADPRYSKRLAIVVPYRDRAQHLAQFVPHMITYFERDKLDRQIAVTINIIEQTPGAPFSRGRLGNAGFLLTRDSSDYICIHDVDYLPMWADYSWGAKPARLIWHGLTLNEDRFTFFGAVSLMDNAVFAKANGFPNCYWGWGPEDRELGFRCRNAGFVSEGVWSEEARRTNDLYKKRQPDLAARAADEGVNSLTFELVEKKPLPLGNGRTLPNVWRYLVELGKPNATA